MNKKGYTLLEILVVIAIVATIGTLATINLDKIMSNSREDKYNAMVQDIKEATNTYITIYDNELATELDNLYNNNTPLEVSIFTLQNVLLLDTPLKDPRNNKTINPSNTKVTITYSSDSLNISIGTISYE